MFMRTWRLAWCAALVGGLVFAQTKEPTAAVVNGIPIRVADVEAELTNGPLGLPSAEDQRRVRQMEALGMLIDKLLMRQFLDKQVGLVPPEELNKKLVEFEAALLRHDRKMSLAEYCHETNQSHEQVKAGLSDQLRWNVYANGQLTDAFLEQYYKDNRDHFDKVTVRASHIAFRVSPSMTQAERQQLRERLLELRQTLTTDTMADFAELARRHSMGPHAARGGDVGYFPRKMAMDEAFAQAAFALPVGGISEVVETEFGLHLIKVTDRKPGEATEFARIKEAVRAFCSDDLRQSVLSQQRKAPGAIKIELP